jgi:hypothetical protein
MANFNKLIKKKPRKNAKQIQFGLEPIIVGEINDLQMTKAFNWYNEQFDTNKGKAWLLEYLKKDNRNPQLIREIRSAPDWRTTTTSCWMARMMLNGTIFPAAAMARFNDRLKENALYGIKTDAPKETTNVISIQDRTKRAIDKLLTEAEEKLDADPEFSMYEFLTAKQATAQAASAIRSYYLPMMEEALLDDDQVRESYGKKLKFWQKVYTTLISDCDRYLNNKKAVKVRKPRAVKMKTSADVVKHIKYQAADNALKLVSVDPQKIVGASQLWIYNTKTRMIGVYHTNAPKGFSVKGTTLTGFDADLSICKKLRKPEDQLKEFFGLGKVALRSFLPDIKTAEYKMNGRINGDTILMKVV